ncbi:helix-turn-helix transcriptional regulator [Flavobacteriaceae bacterium]|jgi:putative transcriptional regulator|nr:helix-turn-helix transcriptional regulator [Flavobacteriaceae bacterium]MDB3869196.1 helix-turn-helix transcriptional regulator [Bacteroidia bacterium]MDB4009927.1 helix-turn-helix transcriptional regulator [Polaribacter sp.]MDB9990168.1 helix-turn-helix transcriptional regulator [Flavobacteriales bacterium]MDA9326982.1 helix-turn-helix transcriptional regulator [Flavobacteriaceae bacterium]|tara:strand:- start:247 stop:447 length:201 start_codon:yes stop_codon:yes gene_type:complete
MKNIVRNLRKQRELTQEQLGEIIGVSRQTINAIEKEKFDPSLPTAFKMSKLFEIPIEKFFFFEGSK